MTNESTQPPRANKARLDNRWGCSVGHAFRNFNPPSRFGTHPRPRGATTLTFSQIMESYHGTSSANATFLNSGVIEVACGGGELGRGFYSGECLHEAKA